MAPKKTTSQNNSTMDVDELLDIYEEQLRKKF